MVCCSELLCRSAKRVFRRFLTSLDRRHVTSTAIVHFLNCLFVQNTQPLPHASLIAEDIQIRTTSRSINGTISKGRRKKVAAGGTGSPTVNGDGPDKTGLIFALHIIYILYKIYFFPNWNCMIKIYNIIVWLL